MPVLFLNIIKILFIALLFLFLWQVARSIRAHVGTNPGTKPEGFGAELVLLTGSEESRRVRIRHQGHVVGRSPTPTSTSTIPMRRSSTHESGFRTNG